MAHICPHCKLESISSESRNLVVSNGSFVRKSDSKKLRRFLCRSCGKSFSESTCTPCFGQKKRHLNPQIFLFMTSGVAQRRIAKLLRINRKTVVRKFIFLGICALTVLNDDNKNYPPVTEAVFDDLETFEHSKMKPLSVIMMSDSNSRRILGFRVASMPAKGHLAKAAVRKYGPRFDERPRARRALFESLTPFIAEKAIIKSDSSAHYPEDVKKYFPGATHFTFKGRRSCVVGQGELKAGGFDPLFTVNHNFAMTRANINRLFRRTWNTTKKKDRLNLHLAIYTLYHNWYLIHNPAR